MPILKPKASHETAATPATHSFTALLPVIAILPALTAMFADRLSTAAWVVLMVTELALIATTGALAARAAARTAADRTAADRARRDAEVLDALEPLSGARR
ncbi:hypothetical protein ACFTWH_18735 [Streptomyces sp. NPDC057011]|uniref:hypothetical protein n=1 Tax=unclassified Streptomyces TaxID=2593676 RepID=UPI00362C6FCA